MDGVYTVEAHTISSRAEVGVLNRNKASSARLVSLGTGPPDYIG